MMKQNYKVTSDVFIKKLEECFLADSNENLFDQYSNRSKSPSKSHPWTILMEHIYFLLEKKINEDMSYLKDNLNQDLSVKVYSKNSTVSTEDKVSSTNEWLTFDAAYFREGNDSLLEYLTDLGLYKKRKNIWDLLVVIEHENNNKDHIHELKKLLFVNSPLRGVCQPKCVSYFRTFDIFQYDP